MSGTLTLLLMEVGQGKEVPKKRDFNFDGQYLGQMSLFSPKWDSFGTAHASTAFYSASTIIYVSYSNVRLSSVDLR